MKPSMKFATLFLAVAVLATGCAARRQPVAAAPALGEQERAAVMRNYLGRLPAGSRVRVVTEDGERFSAMLLAVDQDRLVVQPLGRLAVPSRALPIASVRQVEPQAASNGSLGKAVAIGVVTGAAAFLTMLMVAIAAID